MNPPVFLLPTALAILFCLAPIVSSEDTRGSGLVSIKDQQGNEVGLYKESHALVIGESDYTGGWKSLPGVRVDVGRVRAALEANGFAVRVAMNPSLRELEDTIRDFIHRFGRDPENRLLFYFAGHGHTLKLADGRGMGYFVPADAPDPARDEAGFKSKAAAMEIMEYYARQIEAKHALFLFDSCFSGTVLGLRRGGSSVPPLIESKTVKPVRQFITAGDENQQVPDESLFRVFFVRALGGEGDLNRDGYVLGSELYLYLNDKITNYSGSSQTPLEGKIRDTLLDQGDFVFPLKTAGLQGGLTALEEEKKRLEAERIGVEEERKRVEMEQQLAGERRKLEAEKKRLREEQEKLARLEPPKELKPDSPASGKKVRIATKTAPLNVWDAIGSKKVVHKLDKGTVVPVVSEKGDWYEVEYSKGKKGWISKKFCQVVGDWKPRLIEEQEKLARLQPEPPEPPSSPGPPGMVKIPGGTFYAGAQNESDNPVRELEIGTFSMDKYEVTQAEYEKVMGNNPSIFKGSNLPVENVTWHEAETYCRRVGKRLPTEWEWEKAAKGGSNTMYPWGNEVLPGKANFCDVNCEFSWKASRFDDGYKYTAPVGSYPPNGFGLYDMAGNVWEWTASDYDDGGGHKVLRGGSWNYIADYLRSADRYGDDPGNHHFNNGFRCVQ